MYVAARPYLTAGLAVVAVGAIALNPVAPPPDEITQRAHRAMSTALTASTSHLDQIRANLEAAAAIPGPVAATVVAKAQTIVEEFAAGFGGLIGGDMPGLEDGLPAILAYIADRLEPASERGYIIPGLYQDMSTAVFNGGRDIINLGIDSIQILRFAAEIALEDSLRSTGIGPLVDLANILYPLTVAGDQIGGLVQAQVTTVSNLVRDLVNIQVSIVSPPVVGVIRDAVEAALIEGLRIPAGLGTPQGVVDHLVAGGIDLAEKFEEAATTTLTAGGTLTKNTVTMGSIFAGALSHAAAQLIGTEPITPAPDTATTLPAAQTGAGPTIASPASAPVRRAASTFTMEVGDLANSSGSSGSNDVSDTVGRSSGSVTEADEKRSDSVPATETSTHSESVGKDSVDGSSAESGSRSGSRKDTPRHRMGHRTAAADGSSAGSESGSGSRKGKPSHRKVSRGGTSKNTSTSGGSGPGSSAGSGSASGSGSSGDK